MFGYQGRTLKVDLTQGKIYEETLDEGFARKYVGGVGFGFRWLYDTVPARTDPLSPKNKLIFATGPLSSINFLGSTGISITTKSPLTGLITDSDMRGRIGGALKATGHDALIIEGKSSQPVFLQVTEDSVDIIEAKDLWGKDIKETHEKILSKIGDREAAIASIGIAGENLVKYAAIGSDLRNFAGRGGTGAVMGSKNLKAIVVRGKLETPVADADKIRALIKEVNRLIKTDGTCDTLSKYGTWNTTGPADFKGILPTRNFQKTTFEYIDRIDGDGMLNSIWVGKRTCPGCAIGCRHVVKVEKPYPVSPDLEGPQYESVASLGPLLSNSDPVAIAKANELCNLYGIDTISTGVVIAFVMECIDREVLTKNDLGFELKWGEDGGILRAIETIAHREGIGNIMAEGVRAASKKIGKGSENWAMHVKGSEVPMHDPRGKKGMGLAYATALKGADHESTMHEEAFERENAFPDLNFNASMSRKQYEGKPLLVKTLQDYWGIMSDALTICKFPMASPRPLTPTRVVKLLNLVTGWNFTVDEFLMTGERIFNLGRLFDLREGVGRSHDSLPGRFREVLSEGGSAGENFEEDNLQKMLDEYYHIRGWDNEGRPYPETLERLGLEAD
jgi:aldehyde:ferredoxin oxidoreductase